MSNAVSCDWCGKFELSAGPGIAQRVLSSLPKGWRTIEFGIDSEREHWCGKCDPRVKREEVKDE